MKEDDLLKSVVAPNGRSLYDVQLRSARRVAIVLATATTLSLVLAVFAFIQNQRIQELEEEMQQQLVNTSRLLQECRQQQNVKK
jgi:hypothetical protein